MATIEVYQKVEEITIAELRHASMNRSIAQAEKARQEEEERLRREVEERRKREKSFEVLAKVANAINATAEKGCEHLEILWTYDENPWGVSDSDWKDVGDMVTDILKSHGYSVHEPHWYTSSWRSRSGKIGYVDIYWHES